MISANPCVDPQNLTHLNSVGIRSCAWREGGQPIKDELVQPIGGFSAAFDVRQGDGVGKARIRDDRFGAAVESGVGGGHIQAQGAQPLGHILHRDVGGTIFIDEVAIGIDGEAEVVDGIQDHIDQIFAMKELAGAIAHQLMEAGFHRTGIIAMGIDEGLEAGGIGAHPGVESDQILGGEDEG